MSNANLPSPATGKLHRRSLGRCFATQFAIVYALMLHSITSQSKKARLGYFWELFDPLMQIAIWFVLFAVIGRHRMIYDMNSALFLSTGIVALFFFQKIAQEMPKALRGFGAFARAPGVNRSDLLIAGGLMEAVVMSLVAAIIWGGVILGGFGFAPAHPLGAIAGVTTLGALGFGFGWFNAMAIALVPVYGKFLQILFRVLFFTSGAIFPLEQIPSELFRYLQWNPVYQGVDLVRSAWSYTYDTNTSSTGYVLLWAAVLLFGGLLLDKHAQRAEDRGQERALDGARGELSPV
jgi:capsular polysaccharide transport system permease protein